MKWVRLGLITGLVWGSACGDGLQTGSVEITLRITGPNPDPDGCKLAIDGGSTRQMRADETVVFSDLEVGLHSLAVINLAPSCSVAGGNPQPIEVREGATSSVELEILCVPGREGITVSKIMLGVVPNGNETLEVAALDADGDPDGWSASVRDPTIARVSQTGSQLTVTGLEPGDTTIEIVSLSGLERDLPVKVYDRFVLDVGELLIRYVDEYTLRWSDRGSGGRHDGAFYHPIVPAGWHALGSLGVQGYANPNGQHWMILVQEDGESGALARPNNYYREYDDDESGATLDGSFWTAVCPDGFVSLGAVAQRGWSKPSLDDVVCVRKNLTRPGVAGQLIWNDRDTGAIDWIGMWRINIPQHEDWADDRMYLDPNTFVGTGSEGGICQGSGCWIAPASYPHMNVLAVEVPLLFDTGNAWFPRLTSTEEPSALTEPFEAKAMLVPFSAVLSGAQIKSRTHELVTQSPFVRFEKVTQFHRLGWIFCGGTLACDLEYAVQKGIEEATSTTFSQSVGVSITVEGGVSFLGSGGKASGTVSYEFGYSTTESRAVFEYETWSASKPCPPETACAIWTDKTTFLVKRHLSTGGLGVLSGGELSFDGGLSLWTDEYR
jgi:hypothetical protein